MIRTVTSVGEFPLVGSTAWCDVGAVSTETNSAESKIDPQVARGRWSALVLALLGGSSAALGHAPFSLWPATLLGLAAVMLLLTRAPGARGAALLGWVAGVGYFAVSLHWLIEPFLIDVARHGWMAPFALTGMAAGLALFWALAFGVAALVARPDLRPLALAFALPMAEWLRSVVLSGFPWALPAYAWSETPAIHAASFVGPYGLTALTTLAAAGLALGVRRRSTLIWMVVGLAPLLAVVVLGWWQARDVLIEADEAPVIRLVQPNAPQREKWDPERAQTFVARQLLFTAEPPVPDLVVWPESAIPLALNDAGPLLAKAVEAAGSATVILGATRYEGPRAYNSLIVLGPGGEVLDVYDKHHLVPFGEYIPFGGLARLLGLRSFAARDGYGFSPGEEARRLDLGWMGHPLPLICYEAIFPSEVGAGERPDWLLQITNDAWFGTFSGPYQHLAQARFRAVEQGVPMVRVANTGISAVIDSRGRIVTSLPLGQGGYIDAALPAIAPPTLYSRMGDLPVLAILLLGLAVLALLRKAS